VSNGVAGGGADGELAHEHRFAEAFESGEQEPVATLEQAG
jgi:hypothetical protein